MKTECCGLMGREALTMKSKLRRLKVSDSSGFTLIELLVVIIILGILSGIVVASVRNARADAVVAACKADARSLRLAFDLYYLERGNAYPTGAGTTLYSSSEISNALVPDYLRTNPPIVSDISSTGLASAGAASSQGYLLAVTFTKTSGTITSVGPITGYTQTSGTYVADSRCRLG